jgi:hypothetical protein
VLREQCVLTMDALREKCVLTMDVLREQCVLTMDDPFHTDPNVLAVCVVSCDPVPAGSEPAFCPVFSGSGLQARSPKSKNP